FGRSRARGVVVDVQEAAPVGIKALPVERVLHELPPTLVDLALWLADYYGSTPGRALELVAPVRRQPRKEQGPPAERQSLEGEAEPARLSDDQQGALARIAEGGRFLLYGPTGSGKTEVYLQAAASARVLATRSRCSIPGARTLSAGTSACGSRVARRAWSSAHAQRSSRRC